MAEYMQERSPSLRGKVEVFHLSYDDSHPATPGVIGASCGTDFVFLHAGFLYGGAGRNARSLVRGLALAGEIDPDFATQGRLRLLGAGPGGEEAVREAALVGIPDSITNLPQVPLAEAVAEMGRADVQVVIKFRDKAHDRQIPGKLFQCLGQGKPVLGIMGKHTEAAEILRRSGIGIVIDDGDVEGIADAMLRVWRDWRQAQELFRPDWEYIRQYSRSSFSSRLDEKLEKV
jgi:glycosyltransferase involved in cell wall biosynthesis